MTRSTRLEQALRLALGLLLVVLPFQTIFILEEQFLHGVKWEYGTIGWYGTEGLLWVAVPLFILWYTTTRRPLALGRGSFRLTPDRMFLLGCLAIILYSFLSMFWAPDSQIAFQQAFRILESVLLLLMLFLGPLPFRSAAVSFIGGATLQSILGIWQFLSQSTVAAAWLGLAAHPAYEAGTSIVASGEIGRWLRAYGGFPHPNIFGGYVAVSIFLTGCLLFCGAIKKAPRRAALQAALILQAAALFFTFSRSAWIAACFTLLVLGYMAVRKKKPSRYGHAVLPVLALIGILSVLFVPIVQTRFAGESYHESQSASERISGYKEAAVLFYRHPWFGVGAGNYTAAAFARDPSRPGWEYQPVHSVPLLLLVEFGLAGAIFFLFVLYSFFRLLWAIGGKRRSMGFFFIGVLLPILFLDHYLFSSYVGLMAAAVIIGLDLRYVSHAERE